MNLLGVTKHISNLIDIFCGHRQDSEFYFKEEVCASVINVAQSLNIEMKFSRQCARSEHSSNPGTSNIKDYCRQVIYVMYLDCLISSLTNRFSDENTPQYELFNLQLANKAHFERDKFKKNVAIISHNYNIDNFQLWGNELVWFLCTRQ